MTERKEEADANRALALLHELAGDVVDRRDMVGVDRVPQAERIGEQRRSEQDRSIAQGDERPEPDENVAADQDGVDGDQPAAQIGAAFIQNFRDIRRHGTLACCSRKTARFASDVARETNHRPPRPRSAARAMAGLLARGSTTDADLPGFPVIMSGVLSPLTVAGGGVAWYYRLRASPVRAAVPPARRAARRHGAHSVAGRERWAARLSTRTRTSARPSTAICGGVAPAAAARRRMRHEPRA